MWPSSIKVERLTVALSTLGSSPGSRLPRGRLGPGRLVRPVKEFPSESDGIQPPPGWRPIGPPARGRETESCDGPRLRGCPESPGGAAARSQGREPLDRASQRLIAPSAPPQPRATPGVGAGRWGAFGHVIRSRGSRPWLRATAPIRGLKRFPDSLLAGERLHLPDKPAGVVSTRRCPGPSATHPLGALANRFQTRTVQSVSPLRLRTRGAGRGSPDHCGEHLRHRFFWGLRRPSRLDPSHPWVLATQPGVAGVEPDGRCPQGVPLLLGHRETPKLGFRHIALAPSVILSGR